jgi:hypothetical protein
MRFLKRISGQKISKKGLGLANPNHPAHEQIEKASQIADKVVKVQPGLIFSDSLSSMRLVEAIDEALKKSPDDLDLLVVKSAALCCAMQFKSAEELIDEVLKKDPDHFEAKQRKDNWETWYHVFQSPPLLNDNGRPHPIIINKLRQGQSIQIVRDGLQLGILIVRPAQQNDFRKELSLSMRHKWEPLWSDTPAGPIVAHYLLIEDDPIRPYKVEGFMDISLKDKVYPESGYWLMKRLNNVDSCFILLTDGQEIFFNTRWVFPGSTKKTIASIVKKMEKNASRKTTTDFRRAQQWHMENFNMNQVHF